MRRIFWLLLVILGGVGVSVLYRWTTSLPVSWGYVGERAVFMALIVVSTSFFAARDARRPPQPMGWFGLIFGIGFGALLLVGSIWRLIGALLDQRVAVLAGVSEAGFVSLADNSFGFFFSVALYLLGFAMGVLVLLVIFHGRRSRYPRSGSGA